VSPIGGGVWVGTKTGQRAINVVDNFSPRLLIANLNFDWWVEVKAWDCQSSSTRVGRRCRETMRTCTQSCFTRNVKVVELHIVDLEVFGTRSNYTMRRSIISHVVSIVGSTNDKSTIDHSISIYHRVSQLDFNSCKNVIWDLEVFKTNLANIQGNSSISAVFEAREILEYSSNRRVLPVGIGSILYIEWEIFTGVGPWLKLMEDS